MAWLVFGLQQGKGIHLSKIVQTWFLAGKVPSLVNRLNRFLNNSYLEPREWYRPLATGLLRVFEGQDLRLLIDCTKVGFGHRLLSISLAYRKRSLPLVWCVYRGSKGHISADEQIKLLRLVASLLPRAGQVYLLGDAGFESVELMRWLSKQQWRFVIRQNGRTKVSFEAQAWVKFNALALNKGQTRTLGWVRVTEKHRAGWYWLVLHWAKGEDKPWYLLANFSTSAAKLIRLYKLRMWTEQMYGDMKGHGFDLEATHLDDKQRISRLFLAVALTFVWLITLGSWLVKRGFRHLIDVKSRRDKSYFRLGWDWVERCSRLDNPIPVRFVPYP